MRALSRGRLGSIAALAVIIVAQLTVGVYSATQLDDTTPITRREAVERFRAIQAPRADTASTSVVSDPASATEAGPRAGRATSRIGDADTSVVRGRESASTGPYAPPPEGVYSYRTTGGESISLAGASRTYPEETYAAVHHLGGCQWQHETLIIEEHEEKRRMCGEPGRLSMLYADRYITFFGQKDGGDLVCNPPEVQHETADSVGAVIVGTCKGSVGTVRIEATYLGREAVDVGGVSHEAVRIRLEGVITGRAEGTSDERMWLLPSNGLVLRWERHATAAGDAIFGMKVRYEERATFALKSLTPAT